MRALAQEQRPMILILHSYAVDMQRTHDLDNEITAQIKQSDQNYRVRSEFMDTKNFLSKEHYLTLKKIYAFKYTDDQPIGIISTDNNALNFLEQYGKEIFPEAVTVATGVNNAKPPKARDFVRTIISEHIDHVGVLEKAVKAWPTTQTIHVIVDETPTNSEILSEMQSDVHLLAHKYRFEYIHNKSLSEIEDYVSKLDKTNLVYVFPYFMDGDGTIYSEGVAAKRIAKASNVPVVSTNPYQIGKGVLLAHGLSSSDIGRQAANALLDKLRGKPVPHFMSGEPVKNSLYDYKALERFQIPASALPRDAIFVNRPIGFMEKHQQALLPAGGLAGILVLTLLLLIQNLKKQKALIVDNDKIISLDREVIETQRELLGTLGEIIEARSQDGGDHVNNVAKIATLIGHEMKLPQEELQYLEAAATLHDVGKIGIPEAILHKPGKLTTKEFELIKTHSQIGHRILYGSDRPLMKLACTIALEHHEKWDSTGYPQKLRSEEINIYARIVSVADVYDALVSERRHKPAWSESEAVTYIVSESGKSFDPEVVDAFIRIYESIRGISTGNTSGPNAQKEVASDADEITFHI